MTPAASGIAFVKRRSLVCFFVLAYGLSWGFYFLSLTWKGFPFLFPFGSALAALIVAGMACGKDGLKDVLHRCLLWRVEPIWYVAAILVPIVIALIVLALNVILNPGETVSPAGPLYRFFVLFPMAMVDAPLQEHMGWHGFAMPRFPANRSALLNSLILGILLAGWHLPLALARGSIAAPYLIATIASALVTNWIYYNARESALLPILYHTSANTMGLYFLLIFQGPHQEQAYWLLAAVNCAAAIAIVLITGTNLGRPETADIGQSGWTTHLRDKKKTSAVSGRGLS